MRMAPTGSYVRILGLQLVCVWKGLAAVVLLEDVGG